MGGEDVDDCVVGMMRAQLQGRVVGECTDEALKAEGERVKIALSGDGGVGAADKVAWSCTPAPPVGAITRGEFEAACAPLFDRTLAPVRSALESAAIESGEVDEVVLVGGSSRLPAVQERLSGFFGGRRLHSTVDPDLAVAIGAASSGD